MRHPNNGQSEGDLSRLTGTSSTSSTPSSSNDNLDIENNENNLCNDNCAIISSQALILSVNDNENANNIKNSQHLHGHHHHHHHHHHGHHHHGHHHHYSTQQYGQQENQQQQYQLQQNYPSYLPEYIDPLEWQKSRKRKERLDSTSSITQVDRKLQRSNSEELITSSDCEVIRRVSSHEDFKKQPLQERNTNIDCNEDTTSNNLKPIAENDNHSIKSVKSHKSGDSQQQQQQQQQNEPTNNFIIRLRLDTSPARSNNHRWSPHRFDDSSENENERRRSSERFSKTRAPPGRKSGVVKKVGSNSGSGGGKYSRRSGDENAYKYDISHLKYERRGFVSKLKLEEHRKEEAADGEPIISSSIQPPTSASQTNDYNDNNLIDLCLQQQQQKQQQQQQQHQQLKQQQKNNNGGIQISNQQQQHQHHQNQDASTAMPLPWDRSPQDIQTTPVLCRRFATFNDDDSTSSYSGTNKTCTSTTNNNNHHHQYSNNSFISDSLSQSPAIIAAPAVIVDNEPIKSFRTFTKMENLKTREVMQNVLPLGLLQTPEERLKIVNKKLNALKKKVTLLEENYEKTYGYRPSQIERYNDKQIKAALAEINKLRKEKQELKSDPMAALGLKVSGGLDANQKLDKMKETLDEIQNKLNEKRTESNRPENLETLTSDQLVQEKTAVQHSLLYFESLYGRPSTREERDAARPLYDRYRSLKRMITRSISIPAGSGVGSELPTILEHEAMTYETIQQQSSISTDTTTNSLSDHLIGSGNINNMNIISGSTIESPTDSSIQSTTTDSTTDSSNQIQQQDQQQQILNATTINQQQQQQPTSTNDVNLHMLSLDELWAHLERVREEKKDLKKSIRDFENLFEEQNGRKMLKNDRKLIEDTYANYKENKAKVRLLQALIKKHMAK
ncbi:TPR-containing protein DDB_G0280363 isoform X2 [Condylostylus longicornis]|nr:TPR-containing protein DDB_G0280363 isoform X2 [Condylostylus longicornis]